MDFSSDRLLISAVDIKKLLFSILLLFFIGLFSPCISQSSVKNKEIDFMTQFMNEVYSLSFRKADSLLNVFEKKAVDKKVLLTMRSYLSWWRILAGDDIEKNIKKCGQYTDKMLLSLNDEKKYNINTALNYVSLYSLKSRLNNYSSNKIKSLVYFYNSNEHITTLEAVKNKDESISFALGVYYCLYGHIQDKYFLNTSLGSKIKKSNKQNAIRNLESCATSKNQIIRTESLYFLMKIYSLLENNPLLAMNKTDELIKMYPDNSVFWIEKLHLLKTLKRDAEVETLRSKYLSGINYANKYNSMQRNHFIKLIIKSDKSINAKY